MGSKEKVKTRFNKRLQKLTPYIQEDFIRFLKDSKVSKAKIKLAENIDWAHIVSTFTKNYEVIYKRLDIPPEANIFFNLTYTSGYILLEIIRPLLYKLFYFHLKSSNKIDNHIVYEAMKEAIYFIRSLLENFNSILDLEKLKYGKNFVKTFNDLKGELLRYRKKLPKKNIKLYGTIFKKNDEYMEKWGKNNFRRAVHTVIKKTKRNFDKTYQSFDRFRQRNNIRNYKEFENYIYLSKVDNLPTLAKSLFPYIDLAPVITESGDKEIENYKLGKDLQRTHGIKMVSRKLNRKSKS